MLANVEVVAFHLDLGAADGLGDDLVLYGRVLVHAGPSHDGLDAVAAETAHQLVLQRDIELGTARVALAARPAPQLVVYPAGVVVLCA